MVMDKKTKITLVIAALLGALLILTLLQLIWAPQRWLTLEQFFTGLFVEDSGYRVIIFQHNATRVTMGLFVGGGLAVSGVVMQALFRNPMASPYILGLSSGASLGAAFAMLFVTTSAVFMFAVPLFAFITCMATMFIVYGLARVGNETHMETLLLSGIAIGALLQAIVSLLTYLAGDQLENIVFWSMGNISNVEWFQILIVIPLILIGLSVATYYSKEINAMMMGDAHAMNLGVDVRRIRLILLIFISMLTAAAVCFVGTIGFVGLVIPHIMRIIIGPDNRTLIPLSFLAGGVFLVGCDYAAHLFAPWFGVLPVGILTSLIGAPYFIYLLRRRKKEVGW